MSAGTYKRTKEHGKAISKAKKGKRTSINSEFKKGHKKNIGESHPMYGKKHSEETKMKMSEKKKGVIRINVTGEKHYNWKGGITCLRGQIYNSYKTKEWRTKIFQRDYYLCQECQMPSGYIEAHHIKEFYKILEDNNIKTLKDAQFCDELWDIDNGITLCDDCHNKTKKGRRS